MSEKFSRHFLKSRDAETVVRKASEKLRINLEELSSIKSDVEVIQTEFARIFLFNKKPLLAEKEGKIFPTLLFTEALALLPKVYINAGAIPHICNGANLMAPGITSIKGEFKKEDIVVIIEEKYSKPLAIGETLYTFEEARKLVHGVVVENIHFVGDRIWNFIKNWR